MQTDKEKTREYSQINHITLLILEQNIPGSCGTQNILSLNVYMQTHVQTQQYTGFFFFFPSFFSILPLWKSKKTWESLRPERLR